MFLKDKEQMKKDREALEKTLNRVVLVILFGGALIFALEAYRLIKGI